MVDRVQRRKKGLQGYPIVRVDHGGPVDSAQPLGRAGQTNFVAPGEDQPSALRVGQPCDLVADPRTAANHEDALIRQVDQWSLLQARGPQCLLFASSCPTLADHTSTGAILQSVLPGRPR